MSDMKTLVLWRSTDTIITQKITHSRKLGGKTYKSFVRDCGDIPIGVLNCTTNEMMPVVNTRGKAYASRNALRYKLNKKKFAF